MMLYCYLLLDDIVDDANLEGSPSRSCIKHYVLNYRAFWQVEAQQTYFFVCLSIESLRVTQQHRASLLRKELNAGISNSKNS